MSNQATNGSGQDFLFLSEPDLIHCGVMNPQWCTGICEEVFRLLSRGDYLMGGAKHNEHGSVLSFPDHPQFPGMPSNGPERRFIAMPAYVGGQFHACGVKWYGSNIENKKKGLPRSILTITLNDPDTGAPLAFMSANLISSMRTGCVPVVGVKHLSDEQEHTCVLVGCGPVNRASLIAIQQEVPGLSDIVVCAAHEESANRFGRWAEAELGLHYTVEMDFDRALGMGEIILIGASPVRPLHIRQNTVQPGALVILTSPVEADPEYWKGTRIVYDNPKMHMRYQEEGMKELGDVRNAVNGFGGLYSLIRSGALSPLKESVGMGDVILGDSVPDSADGTNSTTTFVTSGMPVYDVACAMSLYRKAHELGIGTKLRLWDSPLWV